MQLGDQLTVAGAIQKPSILFPAAISTLSIVGAWSMIGTLLESSAANQTILRTGENDTFRAAHTNPKRERGRALHNALFRVVRRRSARPRSRFGLVSFSPV